MLCGCYKVQVELQQVQMHQFDIDQSLSSSSYPPKSAIMVFSEVANMEEPIYDASSVCSMKLNKTIAYIEGPLVAHSRLSKFYTSTNYSTLQTKPYWGQKLPSRRMRRLRLTRTQALSLQYTYYLDLS